MALLARWYDVRDLGNALAGLMDALRDAGASEGLIYVVAGLLGALGILGFVGLTSVINIWVERRLLGRIQARKVPRLVRRRKSAFRTGSSPGDALAVSNSARLPPT